MEMYDGIERILADRKAKRMRFAYGGDVRAGDSVGGYSGDTGRFSGSSYSGGYSGPVSRSGMEATQRNVESAQAAQATGGGRGAVEGPGERAAAQASQEAAQRAATRAAQDAAVGAAIRQQQQADQRFMASQPAGGPRTRGTPTRGVEQAQAEAQAQRAQELYNRNVAQKIMGAEVGGQKNIFSAKAATSSATGPGQFTKDTWLRTIEKYRPDILRTYDTKTVLGMRSTNPQLVESMLTRSVGDYSDTLVRNGIAPTEGNMYMVHFLGSRDALKVLKGDPNQAVDSVVDPASVQANKSVLENKTVSDVMGWANRKMASSEPIPVASMTPPSAMGYGPLDSIASEVNKIFGKTSAPSTGGIMSMRTAQAAPSTMTDATTDVVEQGAAAPQSTGATFDWAKGSWSWDKEDPSRKQNLYQQPNPFLGAEAPNSVTGDTPESYAEAMRIPLDQVKSRISTMNGIPQVEFYQKELTDIPAEMVSGLFGGVASLFAPKQEVGPNKGYAPAATTSVKGYGPYGDLTLEQYNQQYGGRGGGVASIMPTPEQQPVAQNVVAETPAATQQTAAVPPFMYTGKVSTVPTTYSSGIYQVPQVSTGAIQNALSLLNRQPFYAGYQTV